MVEKIIYLLTVSTDSAGTGNIIICRRIGTSEKRGVVTHFSSLLL